MGIRTIKGPAGRSSIDIDDVEAHALQLRRLRESRGQQGKTARKPNAAFMKPMTPTGPLAAIIGSNPMPRAEITKKVWDYIRKNKLQDAVSKRVTADDKLRDLFGVKSISATAVRRAIGSSPHKK